MTQEILTKEFLDAIVPAQYNICLANQETVLNGHKPPFRQIFVSRTVDSDKLDRTIQRSENDPDRNWYFSVATYERQSDGRKARNARLIRTLVLDIDIKDGNPKFFSSKGEVAPALKSLHQQVPSLPAPWIVDSGNGVHIYYSLGEDIPPAVWSPLSVLFANVVAKVEPRLIADPVRTKDIASVLRLPHTLNVKQKPAKPVKIYRKGTEGVLDDIRTGLASAAAKLGATGSMAALPQGFLADSKPIYMQGVADNHSFGVGMDAIKDFQLEDLNPKPIIDNCRQMHDLMALKGDVPEPEWLLMLRVISTMAKADDLACHFSSGYDGYNEAETRRKMRHIRQNFDAPSASCDEFNELIPNKCKGCRFRGKVWTPSQIAQREQQKQEIEEASERAAESAEAGEKVDGGFMPQPSWVWQRTADRGRQTRTLLPVPRGGKDGTKDHEPVMDGLINLRYSSARLEPRVVGGKNQMQRTARRVHMQVVMGQEKSNVSISAEEMSTNSISAATKTLRTVGLPMSINDRAVAGAIGTYLNELNALSLSDVRPCYPTKGWVKDGRLGNWSFIAGMRRYFPDGTVQDCLSTAEHMGMSEDGHGYMEDALSGKPVGSFKQWQKGMEVYGGNQYVAQLLLLSGLANLILPLMTERRGGILLGLTGESGAGKTTLMRFLASFMGHYDKYILSGNTTEAAFGSIMRQANCMLIAADDSLTQNAEEFSMLLSLVTGGADKARMKWNPQEGGSIDHAKGFQASLLLTSNYSSTEIIGHGHANSKQLQSQAARTRTLEVNVDQVKREKYTLSEWHRAEDLISENYGHAADRFLRYVVSNQQLIRNALHKQSEWVQTHISKNVPDSQRGTIRFWTQYLALVNVTAYIVCHKLNLLPWNHLKIRDTGVMLVNKTHRINASVDSNIVASMRDIFTVEEYPDMPVINHRRYLIEDLRRWVWAGKVDRRARSFGAVPEGGGNVFTSAPARWRVDSYEGMDKTLAGTLHVDQVVSIQVTQLRQIISKHKQHIGVTGLADLQRALVDGGCAIRGLKDGRLDPDNRVQARISQTDDSKPAPPVDCVEICFPTQVLSTD